MAGLFDFDVEAQLLDDAAIGWDDPDVANINPAQGLGQWGALTATATASTRKPRGRTPPRREYVWVRDLSGEQIGVIR